MDYGLQAYRPQPRPRAGQAKPYFWLHLEKPKRYFLHYFTLFYKKNAKNAIWNKYFKYFQ